MKTRKLFWIFLFVGIGTLYGSWVFYNSTKIFLKTAQTADGVVIDVISKRSSDSDGHTSYSYYPIVRYKAPSGESLQFESNYGSNPPSYNKGENVEVLFDPGDFKNARINSFLALWLGAIICGIIGTIFSLIGGGVLWYGFNKKKTNESLRLTGQRVSTDFTEVKQKNYQVNGRSPWVVLSKWQNLRTGETHIFESESIWSDPRSYLQDKKTLEVLIDPQNPKKHHMDVSFLPKEIHS